MKKYKNSNLTVRIGDVAKLDKRLCKYGRIIKKGVKTRTKR